MVWHTRRRQAAGITAVIAVLALVAGACGDDDGGEETGAGGAIEVTLQEFAVLPTPDSAPAGDVTFDVDEHRARRRARVRRLRHRPRAR